MPIGRTSYAKHITQLCLHSSGPPARDLHSGVPGTRFVAPRNDVRFRPAEDDAFREMNPPAFSRSFFSAGSAGVTTDEHRIEPSRAV